MGKIEVRQAMELDDFFAIAECIYNTDPYIYPTAFGAQSTKAIQSIVTLMKIQGSMFDYRNIIIAVKEDKVCGMLLCNEYGVEWNTKSYYDLIKEYVPDKGNFEYTSTHYFMEQAKTPKHNHIEIIAVCVTPEHRHKGVASTMLNWFVEQKKGKIIELDVLVENLSAVRLYSKVGFEVVNMFKGFNLLGEECPNCYHMIRK